jgi:UDP-3-O-[3-hydroxymyristoyl] glucosamine N-acyltransferase
VEKGGLVDSNGNISQRFVIYSSVTIIPCTIIYGAAELDADVVAGLATALCSKLKIEHGEPLSPKNNI